MLLEHLLRHLERLRSAVSVWSVGRWAAEPRSLPGLLPTSTTCAGVAYHLVQVLADVAAAAEGRPARPVARPDSDLVLPHQLAVMANDIARADPAEPLLRAAVGEVILHRAEIDGARPPDDLGRELVGRQLPPAELLAALAGACPARRPAR